MRSSHLTCVRLCPFLLATAALAPAQVIVPPGFYVTSYPIGVQVTGLDIAPPGPFGERLFLSVSGSVRVVDTLSGSVTTFATGLATGSSAPSGIEFDEGTFGTGELFIAQNLGNVRQVDPSAAHSQFATGGGLNSCNDITFSDPTGPFGAYAFVSNGAFTGGSVSRVDANGSVTPFAAGANMTTALGLAFPPQGSAFGNDLFVADTSGQRVLRIDTAGTITVFASNLQGPTDLAFSTSTAFGDLLYVSDLTSDDVKTIDPQGNVAVFATGLAIDNSGWNGDILFDSFGDALYVANDTLLLRISGEPDIPFCHGNGAVVPCPCGNTAPLLARSGCLNSTGLGGRLDTLGSNSIAASSLAFRASQMPSTTYCILFAGSDLVPETVIGDGLRCVGGSIIRFGVMQANGAGSTSWGPGLNALLGWSPGTSLRFQVWYRDAFVGPCGTHFNVTNASQVTAAP
jgi:hypothetical protein